VGVLLDRLAADALVAGHVVRREWGRPRPAARPRDRRTAAGAPPVGTHPVDFAFAQVGAWCQSVPVLLCIDDAHRLDTASIGLPRRLAWARRSTPSAVRRPAA
jgi:hypothetical protein